MLIPGHLFRASCLMETCDDASLNAGRLKLVRNATSGRRNTFSRLVGIVRSAVWMDLDIVETLRLHGMASPPHRPRPHFQQCLAGF